MLPIILAILVRPDDILTLPTKPNDETGLIIVLHGWSLNAQYTWHKYNMDDLADKTNCYVYYANATKGRNWRDNGRGDNDDVLYMDQIRKQIKHNTKRVYIFGFSDGGSFAHRYGLERNDVTGIIVYAAGLGLNKKIDTEKKYRVLAFSGKQDKLVTSNKVEKLVERYKECGHEAEFKLMDGGHEVNKDCHKYIIPFINGEN